MKKILWITDFPVQGSGYATISQPICNGLVDSGFEVKMLAISNNGEEHWNKFAVIPINPINELQAAVHNMFRLWKPDVVVIALDIPLLDQIYLKTMQDEVSAGIKFIVITPMENGPLQPSWASSLMKFDKAFFISQLAEVEAKKAGVSTAEHLMVGLDSSKWYPAADGEKEAVRINLGFEEDEKVILTVADNHERKNFDSAFDLVSTMKSEHPEMKFKYVIVTREHSLAGWNLMELAYQYGIQNEIIIFERGMPEKQLRLLYVASDAFLLTSKAEGLGLPIMEALSCGLHCVASNTGALTDLLKDGLGWLIPSIFTIKHDIWGNSKRDFIDPKVGAILLYDAIMNKNKIVKEFPTSSMLHQMVRAIMELTEKDNG